LGNIFCHFPWTKVFNSWLGSVLSDLVDATFVRGVDFGDEDGETVADLVIVRVFVTRLDVIGLRGAELTFSSESLNREIFKSTDSYTDFGIIDSLQYYQHQIA